MEKMAEKYRVYEDRIGINCFYDSIVCLLELKQRTLRALDFVHHRFLYSYDSFMSFYKECSLEELLSPTDKYFFIKDELLNLKYKKDYITQTKHEYQESLGKYISSSYFSEFFIDEIKKKDFNYFPISLRVNPMAYSEFYVKHDCIVPRSDCVHRVNICEIDKMNDRAWIIDRGFACWGEWIDLKELYKGVIDEWAVEDDKVSYLSLSMQCTKVTFDDVVNILKNNMKATLGKSVVINGNQYLVNEPALMEFKKDFHDLIFELEQESFGYAGQILGEAFVQHVDETRGMSYLYELANNVVSMKQIEELVGLFEQYNKLWRQFESLLRISVYKGESIKEREKDFIILISQMIECNDKIEHDMENLLYIIEKI